MTAFFGIMIAFLRRKKAEKSIFPRKKAVMCFWDTLRSSPLEHCFYPKTGEKKQKSIVPLINAIFDGIFIYFFAFLHLYVSVCFYCFFCFFSPIQHLVVK